MLEKTLKLVKFLFHKTSRFSDTMPQEENTSYRVAHTDASTENEVTVREKGSSKETLIHVLKTSDTSTDDLLNDGQKFMTKDLQRSTENQTTQGKNNRDIVSYTEEKENREPVSDSKLNKGNRTGKNERNKLARESQVNQCKGTTNFKNYITNAFRPRKTVTKKTLCSSCRRNEILQRLIFAFNVVLLTCNAGRSITAFSNEKPLGTSMVSSITNMAFYLWTLYTYLASYYSLYNHLPTLLHLLQLYGQHYSVASPCLQLYRQTKGQIVIGLIFQLIMVVVSVVGFHTFLPSFKHHLSPFHHLQGAAPYVVSSIYALILFQCLGTYSALWFLFYIVSNFLRKEFNTLTEQFALLFTSREDSLLIDANTKHKRRQKHMQTYQSDANINKLEEIPETISDSAFDTFSEKKTESCFHKQQHCWKQTEQSSKSCADSSEFDQRSGRKHQKHSIEKKFPRVSSIPVLKKSKRLLKLKSDFGHQPTIKKVTIQTRNSDYVNRPTQQQTDTENQYDSMQDPRGYVPSLQDTEHNMNVILENVEDPQDEKRQKTLQRPPEHHHHHLSDSSYITRTTHETMFQRDEELHQDHLTDTCDITQKTHKATTLRLKEHKHKILDDCFDKTPNNCKVQNLMKRKHLTATSFIIHKEQKLQRREHHLQFIADALDRIQACRRDEDDTEQSKEERDQDLQDVFDHLQEQHQFLSAILRLARRCLCHVISVDFITGIPIFCIMIYGLASSAVQPAEAAYLGFVIVETLLAIVFTTILGILVNESAHAAQDVVYGADWSRFSDRLLTKIQLFANRLAHSHFGYDVYGLFVIDRSTVLMVVGTLATYTVVVIQFHQAEIPTNCGMRNNSALSP